MRRVTLPVRDGSWGENDTVRESRGGRRAAAESAKDLEGESREE
jgi:hypothetical protein